MTDVNVALVEEVGNALTAFSEFTRQAVSSNLSSAISATRTTKLDEPFNEIVGMHFPAMKLVRHTMLGKAEAYCFWDADVLVLFAMGTEYGTTGVDQDEDMTWYGYLFASLAFSIVLLFFGGIAGTIAGILGLVGGLTGVLRGLKLVG